MSFEFRAHHPSAYFRFAIMLIVLTVANLLAIAWLFPQLKNVNDMATKTIILILPWIFLLLLPTIILGIVAYRSFVKTYRFNLEEKGVSIERIKKDSSVSMIKDFSWQEVKSVHLIDFEDNHYCNLEFSEKKNDLVIHRESGDFENFFEALNQFIPDAVVIHD